MDDDHVLYFEGIRSNFTWLRLYKDGTYKTSYTQADKKHDGTFRYNPQDQEVRFRLHRTYPVVEENAATDDFMQDRTTAYYYYDKKEGSSMFWNENQGETRYQITCQWEKP